jgi:hypothetical protein
MKPMAGALVFAACAVSACSLRFGTVGAWSNEKPLPASVQGASSVTIPDGGVIFMGGFDLSTGRPLDRVLRFDPKDQSWSQGAPMPVQQYGYAMAPLPNGSVLVAGGQGTSGGPSVLATTWLYSPQLNSWKKGGNLHVPRSGATAALLADGRVLIAGGNVPLATPIQLPNGTDYFGLSSSAETFDPQTNAWSLVGSMRAARYGFALIALAHGVALAAGGCTPTNQGLFQGGAINNAELFDPATGAWTAATPLPEPRCGASAVLLSDGRALLTGGLDPQGGSVTDAFVYDEQKHAWTAAGSTVQRASAPILLADGRVFVAAAQEGQIQGRVQSVIVGGQIFDPASGEWQFATSNSVLVTVQFGQEQSPSPTAVARSDGTAVVLLGTGGVALTFNPFGQPPPALILDSSGLALVLAAVAAALCLWLAIYYVRNRVRGFSR